MKICYIADATSIHTQRWVDYFSKKGHDVHLISYLEPKFSLPGITLHIVPPAFNNLYLSFPFLHMKVRKIVMQLNPDIVHSHFITKFGFHGALLGFHPFFISAWGSDALVIPYWSRLLFYFTKITLNKADIVYATSGDVEMKINSVFGVPHEKIRRIPFGVDTRLFSPAENKEHSGRIIVLSNRKFYPIYDIKTFIRAIKLSVEKNPALHFIIIGYGPEEASIHSFIDEMGVQGHVDFVGEIENYEMPGYLRSADIYVSTSLSDTTPVSVSEAMACELACIVTDVGGVKEVISDGENGFLVGTGDHEAIARRILELSSDRQLLEKVGKKARQTIMEKLDWWALMEKANEDYEAFSPQKQQIFPQ